MECKKRRATTPESGSSGWLKAATSRNRWMSNALRQQQRDKHETSLELKQFRQAVFCFFCFHCFHQTFHHLNLCSIPLQHRAASTSLLFPGSADIIAARQSPAPLSTQSVSGRLTHSLRSSVITATLSSPHIAHHASHHAQAQAAAVSERLGQQ